MAVVWMLLVSLMLTAIQAMEYKRCGGKPADVFFLLDSSGSLSVEDFQKELKFTNDVIDMFDIGADQVKVGVASFRVNRLYTVDPGKEIASKTVVPQFGLGQYSDRRDMVQKISSVRYEGQGTNTGEALAYLHSKGLAVGSVRPYIPHIAIVLTDGMSQDMESTLREAVNVHKAGITVFVIGIGGQVDKGELEKIASPPAEKYVFMIDSFDALDSIKDTLAIKACEVAPITPAPDAQGMEAEVENELLIFGKCKPRNTLDIVFAVDTATIGASNTKFVLRFIANMSEHIDMEHGNTGIATLSNGCSGGNFNAEEVTSAEAVKQELSKYTAPTFNTFVRRMRLKAAAGRRKERVGVLVVSDHLSSMDYRRSQLELKRAQFQRIAVLVLGVGQSVDEEQAKALGSNGKNYLHVSSFDRLGDISTAFLYRLCLQGVKY